MCSVASATQIGFQMIQTISEALAERGYDSLTPVQQAVTDPALQDADLLVSAQTGSGKTVGFGLAISATLLGDADMLGPASVPLALIIAPTRELAFQVSRELGWLYAKTGARVATCVGGMDMRDERRALDRGAHIVVGTPGRLRDHIQRGSLDMSGLRAVVLDEADEMLDLGFREDLEFMLGAAPADRRTLMFSATVPPTIATLAQQYQRDAVRVTTQSDRSQHADIAYQALRVAPQDAENAIINVLRFHEAQNAIVFANTRAAVNRLTARFANRGFAVVCLSGELSQTERTHALQAMRDGRARVCVATDVAARGIDLPNLELVIHAELPSNPESLLHRSGRTGRAGRKGISALVVPLKAVKKAERLLKMARVGADWIAAPSAEEILRRDEERLLSDPVWSEEISDEARIFARRMLEQHAPEAIAAAYLRLYQSRRSAPEELAAPDARQDARQDARSGAARAPFGPSVWFTLSVGRDDRAEPRWLLPLLCRVGGLDKEAIGAIRVQQSETLVELTEASVPGFLAALGDGGLLEGAVRARRSAGAGPGERDAEAPREQRQRVAETPREPKPRRQPAPVAAQAPAAEAMPRSTPPAAPEPLAPPVAEQPRPQPPRDAPAAPAPKPVARQADGRHSPGPAAHRVKERKSGPTGEGSGNARRADGAAPRRKSEKWAKPSGKGAAPAGSRADFKARKPAPAPAPAAESPDRADAADTSKRFEPPHRPKRAKPGGGAAGKRKSGGVQPPRRGER